ncbi:MAG: NAD(P)-dependent oxidoreductase, partial [Acutalibacteraceae bacterium]
KILITGFGRVGKACARVLSGIGTDVYIAARNPSQRSEAVCMGYKAVDISEISRIIYIFDFIINTVPAQIFTIKNIMTMRERAVYIELASKPFGALEADFESEKKRYILASSLPGRFYPNSCAEAIYKTINDYMGKEITNSQ